MEFSYVYLLLEMQSIAAKASALLMGHVAFYPADSRGKLAQVISDGFSPADGYLEKSKK